MAMTRAHHAMNCIVSKPLDSGKCPETNHRNPSVTVSHASAAHSMTSCTAAEVRPCLFPLAILMQAAAKLATPTTISTTPRTSGRSTRL